MTKKKAGRIKKNNIKNPKKKSDAIKSEDIDWITAGSDEEASRLRVFPVDDDKVLVIHVAVQWNRMTDEQWFSHCKGVDSDFKNAKMWIEGLNE